MKIKEIRDFQNKTYEEKVFKIKEAKIILNIYRVLLTVVGSITSVEIYKFINILKNKEFSTYQLCVVLLGLASSFWIFYLTTNIHNEIIENEMILNLDLLNNEVIEEPKKL